MDHQLRTQYQIDAIRVVGPRSETLEQFRVVAKKLRLSILDAFEVIAQAPQVKEMAIRQHADGSLEMTWQGLKYIITFTATISGKAITPPAETGYVKVFRQVDEEERVDVMSKTFDKLGNVEKAHTTEEYGTIFVSNLFVHLGDEDQTFNL